MKSVQTMQFIARYDAMIRYLLLSVVVLLQLGCAPQDRSSTVIPKTVVVIDSDTNGPRFTFIAPDGFEWNSERQIWHHRGLRSSITLSHAPGTEFQTVVDDFTPDRMLASNLRLISKDLRDIDGRPTLLVHANRLNARYPQEACTVAFGTREGCAQLTAIYPADTAKHLKARLESALLNSRYEEPN